MQHLGPSTIVLVVNYPTQETEAPTTCGGESNKRLLCVCHNVSAFPSSVISILKNLVGKDVTKIALPVHLNEPLSFTQVKPFTTLCTHIKDIGSCIVISSDLCTSTYSVDVLYFWGRDSFQA